MTRIVRNFALLLVTLVALIAAQASSAATSRGPVGVCRVSDNGTQAHVWVKRDDVRRFIERHHGSYLGDCLTAPAPTQGQINRAGACDPTGKFLDLTAAQVASGFWTDPQGVTVSVIPAVETPNGLTCNGAPYSFTGTFDGIYPIFA